MKELYSIKIEAPQWEGYKYSFNYSKNYGNMSGGCSEAKTKEELLERLRAIVRDWNGFDYIVHREADEVTLHNTQFSSFTPEISMAEVLGNSSLSSWQ